MKRRNVLSVLIVMLLALSSFGCREFQAKVAIKQGNQAYGAKKYDEAIQKYRYALKLAPNIHMIHLNMALAYMAMYVPGSTQPKDLEYAANAIQELREYLKYDPKDEQVKDYLLTMYLNADRKQDAINHFLEQVKEDPNDVAAMQKLAFLYAQAGNFEEALKWYKQRTVVEPKNAEAFYVIGVICWEKVYKFPEQAEEYKAQLVQTGMDALERAIQLKPDYADAYLYENLLYREKAKLIATDPNKVPEDKVDEYNGYLAKAKELQDKAVELRKEGGSAPL
jgi:tetratricopeptide (TPR) repeat protein